MFSIGVDIGGTNISVGIVTDNFEIKLKKSFKTDSKRTYEEVRDDIIKAVNEIVIEYGLEKGDIAWIGIGCPGTCNIRTGIVEFVNNLGWYMVPLEKEIEAETGIQTFVDNDANVAAYGEFLAGAAKGAKSSVTITLGTGVGSGIIINRELFYGENYAGAELGHTVIEVDGPDCTCGRKGCFEVFSSATGLIRMTAEALDENPTSVIGELKKERGKISARTAFDAARLGDSTGKKVVERYIKYLSIGIANVINIFQPDFLCIGGGVCNEGDNLLMPLREQVGCSVFSKKNTKQTRIVICSLGNDAGIIGAAMLGRLRLKTN